MNGRQGDGDENGKDKDDKNRRKYRNTKYDFEEEMRKRVILRTPLNLK